MMKRFLIPIIVILIAGGLASCGKIDYELMESDWIYVAYEDSNLQTRSKLFVMEDYNMEDSRISYHAEDTVHCVRLLVQRDDSVKAIRYKLDSSASHLFYQHWKEFIAAPSN